MVYFSSPVSTVSVKKRIHENPFVALGLKKEQKREKKMNEKNKTKKRIFVVNPCTKHRKPKMSERKEERDSQSINAM